MSGVTWEMLHERQGWSLDQKIDHAVGTVESFVARIAPLTAYVSFSGGKDSTVLLDLCRRFVDVNMPAVFDNTGQEWPEVVKFVRSVPGVTEIRPPVTFTDVLETYGFPLISKEQSRYIRQAQHTNSDKLRDIRLNGLPGGLRNGQISKCFRGLVQLGCPLSELCCDVLKKRPMAKFQREHKCRSIVGTLASESKLRSMAYLRRGGCNSFTPGHEESCPLSIWTERDIEDYIKRFDVKICNIYERVNRTGCIACGFGLQIEPQRIKSLYATMPGYVKAMLAKKNGTWSYGEALVTVIALTVRRPINRLALDGLQEWLQGLGYEPRTDSCAANCRRQGDKP